MEIALLKEKVGSTKDSDDRRMAATSLDDNHRNKRPVRLLPPHILYGDRKNETEKQQKINRRRYEEPTGCSDLSILGYTLNGFYQVKSNESTTKSTASNKINLETIFCAFKQPEGTYNSALIEKRIISRRKNSSKLSSNMIFHAKSGRDLKATDRQVFNITFDEVLLDPGNSFDLPTGTFTVQKSGLYLFIFRGLVIYPQYLGDADKQLWIYFTKNGLKLEPGAFVTTKNQSCNPELDKLVKGNSGDIIMAQSAFYQPGAVFSNSSTTFSAYFYEA